MKAAEAPQVSVRGAEVWPLSVEAYHALGKAGLVPERTELLHGCVYHKISESPLHSLLVQLLQDLLHGVVPAGFVVRTEQPITCADSEPEPDLAVVRGRICFQWNTPGHRRGAQPPLLLRGQSGLDRDWRSAGSGLAD